MKKVIICLTCLIALAAETVALSIAQGDQNTAMNANATMNATNNVTVNSTNNITNSNITNSSMANSDIVNNNTANNISNNTTVPALRVGFETVKPTSNLDRFGTKPVYNIEAYSKNQLLYNGTNASQVQPVFNVSQRAGTVPTIVYSTGQTKPTYSVSASPAQPVYNIEGYSPTKVINPTP